MMGRGGEDTAFIGDSTGEVRQVGWQTGLSSLNNLSGLWDLGMVSCWLASGPGMIKAKCWN
jgi:hypothetical protein